jgi:hypothetical protein
MKVFEKLSALENIAENLQMVLEICRMESCCPAKIENKYRFLGEKAMKKFCEDGCSVACLSFYLDMPVKSA